MDTAGDMFGVVDNAEPTQGSADMMAPPPMMDPFAMPPAMMDGPPPMPAPPATVPEPVPDHTLAGKSSDPPYYSNLL